MAGSVPEKEFEETEHKAAALRRAIELAMGDDGRRGRSGAGDDAAADRSPADETSGTAAEPTSPAAAPGARP